MSYGLYVATAGAVARQNQLDVVSNNLANATTPGYRSVDVGFQEVLAEEQAPDRHLVALAETRVDPRPGPLRSTGNPLDLSLEGRGYFALQGSPGVPVLTRTVSLKVDESGLLSDQRGRPVMVDGAELHVDPASPVAVTAEGEVTQGGQVLGRLSLYDVGNGGGLSPLGDGLYTPNDGSGPVFEVGAKVLTGTIEGSNVETVGTMVKMIRLERDHQSLMKVIQAYREADEGLIAAGRKP